jgi:hypothetical protein
MSTHGAIHRHPLRFIFASERNDKSQEIVDFDHAVSFNAGTILHPEFQVDAATVTFCASPQSTHLQSVEWPSASSSHCLTIGATASTCQSVAVIAADVSGQDMILLFNQS